MIVRTWRGWAPTTERADAYERLLRQILLPVARNIRGFQAAEVLRRSVGDEIEFVILSRFDDLDAIRAFAGDDHDIAKVPPEARGLLVRWDDRCTHYEVALSDRST